MARVLVTDGQELAALGAVRSLGRAGHHVTVVYSTPEPPPSAASRFAAGAVAGPDPWREQPAFRGFLRDLVRRAGFDAVLPISEAALVAVAALRGDLPGALLLPGDAQLRFTLSKYHATRAAMAAGIDVPPTAFLRPPRPLPTSPEPEEAVPSDDELLARIVQLAHAGPQPPGRADRPSAATGGDEPFPEPLLLKTDNHFLPDGRYQKGQVARVGTRSEALALLAEARAAGVGFGVGMIAQRPIPGHGEGVFLLRHGGQTVLRFVHQRLHEVPYSGGVSSLRRSMHDDLLVAQAERLLAAIDYSGVAMLEFRRAPDGRAYFLEINGRLWGSLALCLHAGVDFPRALVASALSGEPAAAPIQPPYPDGLRCRNVLPGEIEHVVSLLRAERSRVPLGRKLGALGEFALLSLDPTVRHDHLWASDPLPALVQAQQTARDLGHRLAARLHHRADALRHRPLLQRTLQAQPALRQRLRSLTASGDGHRVLFLCYGNICRSPFAAEVLRGRALPRVHVASAGFHPVEQRATPPRFVSLARDHGVDLGGHRSRRVRAEELEAASLIVVMDAENLKAVAEATAGSLAVRSKVLLLGPLAPAGAVEIADPFLRSVGEARLCYAELSAAVDALAKLLA
ncbi:MAG: ATP-grasp domain-containing protein [Polyangia bacterium]